MNKHSPFEPDWTSPPGDTIAEILASRRMSVDELARRADCTSDRIRAIIEGRATITIVLARHFEKILGSSREFWMSRDFHYRQQVSRLRGDPEAWLRQLPVADMVRFGWITAPPHPEHEVATCLQFFDVSSVQAWHTKYAAILDEANFRQSRTLESWPAATAAWLRRGEIEADAIDCAGWDPHGFRLALQEARNLTRLKEPRTFVPRLRALSAEHGVAVTVVRAPAGCRASGATRFVSSDKALLLLSFRYRSDDHFWFSFFHEAGHLLLHGQQDWVVETANAVSDDREREANRFAEQLLIPESLQQEFRELDGSHRAVIRFARRARVSPGIVVGQLQHHGLIPHSTLNRLKRRFTWEQLSHETV
ncbi:MAG: ImmA/IrrE family metallo-endopeptidase [Gemmatimonadales bacterium]|nr:ImmA/IrrE family metallo-endopeptidase [Gemmatimonadales bacterium]